MPVRSDLSVFKLKPQLCALHAKENPFGLLRVAPKASADPLIPVNRHNFMSLKRLFLAVTSSIFTGDSAALLTS